MDSKLTRLALLLLTLSCSAQIMQQAVVNSAPVAAFDPSQLSGLQAWFAADSGLTCISGCTAGHSISQWNDKSSNANNLTTGAGHYGFYQPSQINGLPAVNFDGSGSFFSLTTPINLTTATHALTIFVVAKPTVNAQSAVISGGASGGFMYDMNDTNKLQGAVVQNVAGLNQGTAADTTAVWHQANVTYNAVTLAFRTGSATDGSSSKATAVTSNETVVGENGANGASLFTGYIAEIIVYNRVLSGAEIGQVETYLNGRYGI